MFDKFPYSKTFAFTRGGPNRLKISWNYNFRDALVELDGRPLGEFPRADRQPQGKLFILPGGSRLLVKRSSHPLTHFPLPELRLNEVSLPGSATDPRLLLIAAAMNFVVAGPLQLISINFADGWTRSAGRLIPSAPFLVNLMLMFFNLVVGVMILRRSRLALVGGVLLTLYSIGAALLAVPGSGPAQFILLAILFSELVLNLIGTLKGFSALKAYDLEFP